MITVPVGEFKAKFSHYLKEVEKGEKIAVSYGRKKEPAVMLVPIEKIKKKIRQVGLLEKNGAKAVIMPNWNMTDEELLDEKLYN